MKPEYVSDALNHLSDEVIEEADRVRTRACSPRGKWLPWAAAACL